MMIGINRFMTLDEVRAAYGLPEPLAGKVLPLLPVAVVQDDGIRLYLESEVDRFLSEFIRDHRHTEASTNPPSGKRPGRKPETTEIADYIDTLVPEKSWKEVFALCKKRWPESKHVQNREQVRRTWGRHYRKKKRTE
jgi:hypothetical protein